jgi:hypothetical protein
MLGSPKSGFSRSLNGRRTPHKEVFNLINRDKGTVPANLAAGGSPDDVLALATLKEPEALTSCHMIFVFLNQKRT